MATYTADLFMTLDGFGTGPVGYWGKEGPELLEQRARKVLRRRGPDAGVRGGHLPRDGGVRLRGEGRSGLRGAQRGSEGGDLPHASGAAGPGEHDAPGRGRA